MNRFARIWLRIASILVPRRRRKDWAEEWLGELATLESIRAHALDRSSYPRPLTFVAGSIPHALMTMKEEWTMGNVLNHFRFAGRILRRSPGFTFVAVLTLALGIGANTVVYSIVDGTILNPFPYPDANALVGVGPAFPRLGQELSYFEALSPAEYQDIREQSRTLEKVVAWDMGNRQLSTSDGSTNVFSCFWWGDGLETLGMLPAAGRGFLPGETERGDPVAIISHRLWENLFGSDPGAIGSALEINGESYTLVGVLPPRTQLYGSDLWIPMSIGPEVYSRNRRQFQVLARIVPGSTLEEVNTELNGIARRVEATYGGEFQEYEGWSLVASTWNDINSQTFRAAGFVLLGAVFLVLLLVCANLANLLMARAMARSRDFALRTALGASRRAVLFGLLTESLFLAVLGGFAGVFVSVLGIRAFARTMDVLSLPFVSVESASLNSRVLLYTAVVSILAGIAFGLLPAWKATRANVQDLLQAESRTSMGGRGRHRLQRVLVGAETAVALALLVASGLLVNSFLRMQRVDPGFDLDNAITMRLTLPWEEYDTEAIMLFFRQLRENVEGLPGVRSAAVTSQYPPTVFSNSQFSVEGMTDSEDGTLPSAYLTLTSPGYFDAMGIPLMVGRALTEQDRMGSQDVAVVNQAAARRFFGGEDPVGQRFRIGGPEDGGEWITVVGMVGDTRNRGLDASPQPEIYGSTHQVPGGNQFFLVVRTETEPHSIMPAIRETVAAMDPDQPIYGVRTLEEAYAASVADKRIASIALTIFAGFALLLSSLGIYSVVAFGVAERTREIGVRMALGAEAGGVRGLVVRQALLPVVLGIAVGLGLAFGLQGFLQSLLFQISGTDPLTLGAVTLLLLAVAGLASYLPARRASRMDPVEALRKE
ncbi:MAG: ABC transporter permease [Gemmatimonadota bacterium]|jgi:predicted permease